MERAEPLRIREAVSYLCRYAFSRSLGIVFGAHPAISPLLLEAASRFSPEPAASPRVIIFQSEHFAETIPRATLELANWKSGELVWTKSAPTRADSLTLMRSIMAASPGLEAAIFIGGMEGLYEEARLFREHNRNAPMVAIGSTGSAASRLCVDGYGDLGPDEFHGRGLDTETLRSLDAYSVVFQQVFAGLGLNIASWGGE